MVKEKFGKTSKSLKIWKWLCFVFSVNENLVHLWRVIFFLDVSHNISQNAKFWKDVKKCRNVILFWTGSLCDIKEYIIHIKNYSHSDKNILLLLYNKGLIIFSFLAVNRNQLKKNKNVPESGVWKFSNSLLFNTDFLAKLKIHIILKL